MKIINHTIESKSLGYSTSFNVLIPMDNVNDSTGTLYLLHGAYGNENDWLNLSPIKELAANHNFIIVFPRGEQSFYTNALNGPQYEDFISEELKSFIENTYKVSKDRKNTFIAGLSMGGYGALKIALKNKDKYSLVGSFSGATDIAELTPKRDNAIFRFDLTFGDISKLRGSKHDLFKISSDVLNDKQYDLDIFLMCGTEDHLYEDNVRFKDHLSSINYDFTYIEGPGVHDWDYWSKSIAEFLNFMKK
ncbi:alpha/beta hydrolase family protein [Clostridium sp. C8]|uniref:alpha/beta hydrolase n=1 Tax=Clostridium sp. C8 TaxID=1667357 RepID=UPI00062E40F5|nr:alpha/beta hydrolase family protein [Clostridium sp. C8]KLE17192.1 hypothetical protein AAT22_02360 [Clostridium sp. C8]